MVESVPSVRCQYNQVAGVPIEKVQDLIGRRRLTAEHDIVDGDAEPAVDRSQRFVLIHEIPLREQASQPHMRMFPTLANVILQNIQDMQLAFRCQCDAQSMGICAHARRRKSVGCTIERTRAFTATPLQNPICAAVAIQPWAKMRGKG